jgi:hypothetical protein
MSQCIGTTAGRGSGKLEIISNAFFGLAVNAPLIGIASIFTAEDGNPSNEIASPQCANMKSPR